MLFMVASCMPCLHTCAASRPLVMKLYPSNQGVMYRVCVCVCTAVRDMTDIAGWRKRAAICAQGPLAKLVYVDV